MMKPMALAGACLGVLVLGVAPGEARSAKCLLVVDGKTYIDGRCDFSADRNQFSISNNRDGRALFFAMVDTDTGPVGRGFWNGTLGATHAHSNLGELKRKGACWENERARVCAWASP